MEWQQSDGQYTLQRGTCLAEMWKSGSVGWMARVSQQGQDRIHGSFSTRDKAQAWCVGELAARQAAGKCGKVA
jgi:hypothetical protein